jgi:voltage-gated potassium channel
MTDNYMSPGLVRWGEATDAPLMVLAIASLPLLVLELTQSDLPRHDEVFLYLVNVVVLVAFAVDYFVELRLATDRRLYARKEWTSLVIVISQGVAVLPVLTPFGLLRILRAGRGWRALLVLGRILAIGGAAASEGKQILRRHAASFALGMAGLTWLSSAVAFTIVEDVGADGRVHSFFDALWWSTATITTVGYGDILPITTAGRIVGGFTMLVGISTFAIVTAKVAEILVRGPSAPGLHPDLPPPVADAGQSPVRDIDR